MCSANQFESSSISGSSRVFEACHCFVHGDYHLNNAIFGVDGTVRAILDWELCTVGDPLADVGLMVAYWKVAVIVEGVYRRWLNDPTNGSDAGGLRPAVDRLAALSLAALESDRPLARSNLDEESGSADVGHTIAGEQQRS